jgi:TolA-binding protein
VTDDLSSAEEAMDRTKVVQAAFLTLVCWIFIATLVYRDRLTGVQTVFAILLAFPFCWYLTKATRAASALFATKLIGGLASAGNIKYQQGYSIQESLIARGRFDEAAESFRVHLMEFPDDTPARYRLATLHLRERKDPAAAEQEFLNIRRRPHDRSTAKLLANHFVDIYEATGQTGKLMAELNRMLKEWPGTELAAGAVKLLEQVRRERQ